MPGQAAMQPIEYLGLRALASKSPARNPADPPCGFRRDFLSAPPHAASRTIVREPVVPDPERILTYSHSLQKENRFSTAAFPVDGPPIFRLWPAGLTGRGIHQMPEWT